MMTVHNIISKLIVQLFLQKQATPINFCYYILLENTRDYSTNKIQVSSLPVFNGYMVSKTILAKTCRTSCRLPEANNSQSILLPCLATNPFSLPILTYWQTLHAFKYSANGINTCKRMNKRHINLPLSLARENQLSFVLCHSMTIEKENETKGQMTTREKKRFV